MYLKRMTALLLAMFVLLLAAQPVVAFHYCSGYLKSIELQHSAMGSCCDATNTSNQETVVKTPCCHTITTALSADDLFEHNQKKEQDKQASFSHAILFAHYVLLASLVSEESNKPSDVPPDSLPRKGRDYLAHFCVYII